jgi:hypothetical protein
MSPFHDLGRRCAGPFPGEGARPQPSPGLARPAGRRPGANTTFRVSKFESRVLTGSSRHEEMEYSRAMYMPPNHRDRAIRHTSADEETDD